MPEPEWREIAGLSVEYNAVYAALSFWIAFLLFSRSTRALGESTDKCSDWVLYAISGALVGARVGYFVFEIPVQFIEEPGGLLWQPGFSFHGAVLGLLAGSALFARSAGMALSELCDRLALGGSIGFLLMSLGALLSNSEVGMVSSSVIALKFPIYDEGMLVPPTRFPIFHVQCVWAALVVCLTVAAERRQWLNSRAPGATGALVIALIFAGLAVLDPLKEERTHLAQSGYRITATILDILLALGASYLLLRSTKLRLRA